MYILLQNNHNRQKYLRRQANATISPRTKKTEETGTLTTLSLSACNIYVRAAHRAQRRTIFGELPVNDQKRKQTKTQVALSLHRRHRRTLMTSNGRQTQNKCTHKKSETKHSHGKHVQSLSTSVESTERTTALGLWRAAAGLKRCCRACRQWSGHKSGAPSQFWLYTPLLRDHEGRPATLCCCTG